MHGMSKSSRAGKPGVLRGLTLIEILGFLCMAISTFVGAELFHGRIGGRWGWLLGGLIGFLFVPVVVILWALFMSLAVDGIPVHPSCRNGCCRGSDYELRRFDREFYWVCKCGDRYTRRGRQFLQVTDDGEMIPCRIWRPFRGWFPEEPGQADR
jgi:hypothetical protein